MELIDKSALVAEIEKRLQANGAFDEVGDEAWAENVGMRNAYKSILSFLDTLEVKEVDFERELSKYVSNGIHRFFPNVDDDYCKMESFIWQDYVIETAKHFFELGLKAKEEIYVVTRSEEHSDYVEAVFLNENEAEEYCKPFSEDEDSYARNITKMKIQ